LQPQPRPFTQRRGPTATKTLAYKQEMTRRVRNPRRRTLRGGAYNSVAEACAAIRDADNQKAADSVFRKASVQYHPDKGGDPEQFKMLSACHDEDEQRRRGGNPGPAPAPAPARAAPPPAPRPAAAPARAAPAAPAAGPRPAAAPARAAPAAAAAEGPRPAPAAPAPAAAGAPPVQGRFWPYNSPRPAPPMTPAEEEEIRVAVEKLKASLPPPSEAERMQHAAYQAALRAAARRDPIAEREANRDGEDAEYNNILQTEIRSGRDPRDALIIAMLHMKDAAARAQDGFYSTYDFYRYSRRLSEDQALLRAREDWPTAPAKFGNSRDLEERLRAHLKILYMEGPRKLQERDAERRAFDESGTFPIRRPANRRGGTRRRSMRRS